MPLKIYIFKTPGFYYGNSLYNVIFYVTFEFRTSLGTSVFAFCWFFATTAHQRIIFMFLVKTKLVKNFVKVSDFSSQYSWRKKNPLSELCEKEKRSVL